MRKIQRANHELFQQRKRLKYFDRDGSGEINCQATLRLRTLVHARSQSYAHNWANVCTSKSKRKALFDRMDIWFDRTNLLESVLDQIFKSIELSVTLNLFIPVLIKYSVSCSFCFILHSLLQTAIIYIVASLGLLVVYSIHVQTSRNCQTKRWQWRVAARSRGGRLTRNTISLGVPSRGLNMFLGPST